MKKGFNVELILFFVSMGLCVVCAFAYLKRDDSEAKRLNELADILGNRLQSVEDQVKQTNASKTQETNFASNVTSIMESLNGRITALESHPSRLKLEPVEVTIVTKEASDSLLKRAGIKSNGSKALFKETRLNK